MRKELIIISNLIATIFLCVSIVSYAGEVNSLRVRGKIIKICDTADQIFTILEKSYMVSQTVSKDPNNPNSLLVVKNFNVEGKKFTISFARIQDPGPYRVIKITSEEE